MSTPRFRPSVLVCAGLLSLCVASLAVAQSATPPTQPGGAGKPGASGAPGKSAAPGQASRPTRTPPAAKPIVIEPEFDPVLLRIQGAIDLNEEQTTLLMTRYRDFRSEQRRVMAEVRAEVNAARAAAKAAEEAEAANPPADEGEPERKAIRGPEQARGYIHRVVLETLAPLNERFLADVRGMLDEPQLPAWERCATKLDLDTVPRYFTAHRPELRWRDPALGPMPGDMAPRFALRSVGDETVSLESLLDKPVVLFFGSWTSPQFRSGLEQAEVVRRAYADKVHCVLVYSFEAHPTDGWKVRQNTIKKIEIPQHKSFDERMTRAREMKTRLAPDWIVLVDDFENSVTKSYFGQPNRCYVIGADGTVRSNQASFDEKVTVATLYETLTGRSAATP